jgi:hypothetical protein
MPEGFKRSNIVKVEKMRREDCMLGDDVDFQITPSLQWLYESDSDEM